MSDPLMEVPQIAFECDNCDDDTPGVVTGVFQVGDKEIVLRGRCTKCGGKIFKPLMLGAVKHAPIVRGLAASDVLTLQDLEDIPSVGKVS